jgi:hypothetical protein
MTSSTGPERAVSALLALLGPYRPQPQPSLPASGVGLVSVAEQPVGLGNLRGERARGALGTTVLAGVRLDALVRFRFWSAGPAAADDRVAALIQRLLHDKDLLRGHGLLRLGLDYTASAPGGAAADTWRSEVDFRLLYEYGYVDSDDPEQPIARIPVRVDLGSLGSPDRETTTVTDDLVRWDDQGAPGLTVRGPLRVGGLSALAHLSVPAPTGAVRLTRTYDGAGSPVQFVDLAGFLDQVSGPDPAVSNAAVTVPTLPAFLALFIEVESLTPPGADPGHDYRRLDLPFPTPIYLPTGRDRLDVAYDGPALDPPAVCYLHADGR